MSRTLLLLAQLSEIDTYSFYGLDRRMMEVVACTHEHCATASVASLAAHFGYRETYFSQLDHFNRIFRQVYHITPAAYRAFATREVSH